MKISLELIVYGKTSFKKEDFNPISNRDWCKPMGGLWASPINSQYGWKDWCLSNDFRIEELDQYFLLHFNGTILKIDSNNDVKKMDWVPLPNAQYSPYKIVPDFKKMKENGLDAIWLTPQGEQETRFGTLYNLYGWDCESVLIMNPDCIIPKEELSNLEF